MVKGPNIILSQTFGCQKNSLPRGGITPISLANLPMNQIGSQRRASSETEAIPVAVKLKVNEALHTNGIVAEPSLPVELVLCRHLPDRGVRSDLSPKCPNLIKGERNTLTISSCEGRVTSPLSTIAQSLACISVVGGIAPKAGLAKPKNPIYNPSKQSSTNHTYCSSRQQLPRLGERCKRSA